MVVTFFGHRDAGSEIKEKIKEEIIRLIENDGADTFLVGNNGNFDAMVKSVLDELEKAYDIKYNIVLAYLPTKKREYDDHSHTVFPEGLESVPKRFAISKRNEMMIKECDIVITHVIRNYGGAYQFKALAEKKSKRVINIK